MANYIRISQEDWSGFGGEVLIPYYLKYDEDEKKCWFSHECKKAKVYVSKSKVQKIFEGIKQLDFMKILKEASQVYGCDGNRTVIKLSLGMHDLTISLWSFPFEIKENFEETEKLQKIYNQILRLAKDEGFNTEETELLPHSEKIEFQMWKRRRELSTIQ